ncbi:hypothetical protein KHM83_01490 [Fusibacter paucivorans]|uniref:Cytochrome oxidase subunit III n=1 Tax=Fusibacter paucivorans TaxID=76009 RepID=A0ABS5PJT4_9FIRM|nr:hypothetical protein [Fusibacter paucivorans]MBS7525344.1 hypothetical protein [Fusibacter paucivorans]
MKANDKFYERIGWLLFLGCSICYMWSSYQNRDVISMIGGILFFAACLLFMMPLMKKED